MFKIVNIFSKKGNAILIKDNGLEYDIALVSIDNSIKEMVVNKEIKIKKKFVKTKKSSYEDKEYVNKEICSQFEIIGNFI